MKHLIFSSALFLGLLMLAGGCFTIEKGDLPRTGQKHLLVSNYGWYLFHAIPVACGNANEDRFLPFVSFRNDVTLNKVQSRFMGEARKYAQDSGRTLADVEIDDLCYTTSESVMLTIPGLQIPLPIPYLLTYREVQLSGVVK